jgi:predicted double-glycine peptidase
VRRLMPRLAAVLWLSSLLFAAGPSGVWLDIPFVTQEKDGCGAASVAMVIEYWLVQQGGSVPANTTTEIQRDLHSNRSHGIYASDMQRYFQQNGYATFAFAGEWSDLKQHLQKGRPLIVALKPGSGSLHYVVVAGFDQDRQIVLLNDPAQRKLLKEDRSRFEQEWKGAGRWTLLALPGTGAH